MFSDHNGIRLEIFKNDICNFKNTMLKNRRRKRKREKEKKKQSHKNYKENIATKLITNTKKQKLKIQSRVWNFKNTMLKKRRRKRKRKQKQKQQQTKSQKL